MNYNYTREIEKKLQEFDKYLRIKKYAITTIKQNRNYTGVFLKWLTVEGLGIEEVEYKVFTDFIFHLKSSVSTNQTKRIILAVRHYYESLDIDKNPASGIHIRTRKNSILNEILPYSDLVELYNNYQTLDDRTRRNKVILGLFIYQGITSGGLSRLETRHIKLKKGKIYLSGYGNINSRTLELSSNQLLELQEYLLVIRPRMIRAAEIKETYKLFFSERGSENMKSSIYHLFKAIRKSNPKVSSGKVIRSSVIVEWLKTKDIRIVQYMAGHRWVSSTERYNLANIRELKESLKKHHPLK